MTRTNPKNPRRLTIQEKWALDTGEKATGGGKQFKEAREYIKQYEAKEAKREKQAKKDKRTK
ncbi:hypothetical protein HMPREF1627_00825 [Actinomyces sp. S6-Spd3]|uniref:hypothetical protein n=1 Tax=unclassified Actinomyces TaxID=2609248 RepID=UPI00050ECF45|nr:MULTISPECIES: hypothetical protein [unclassified Actinomyces]KGF01660.1 hypothetical protein HMPREF1628_04950 [Actinomyces sp. S4-C9]KGF07201.1 hypothetical protein HMPREF1627_00825 [Actinomyces sp. S6-Spd3]MDU4287763.1 hypothetical protein [Actinomyces sp.]